MGAFLEPSACTKAQNERFFRARIWSCGRASVSCRDIVDSVRGTLEWEACGVAPLSGSRTYFFTTLRSFFSRQVAQTSRSMPWPGGRSIVIILVDMFTAG